MIQRCSNCLIINLEWFYQKFKFREAINYWFDVIAQQPGASQTKENTTEAKEGAAYHEASGPKN